MKNNTLAHGLASQMLASLYTLQDCIDRCPPKEWNETHNDYPFSQVVFHTIFDCDLSLSNDIDELKGQLFHTKNKQIFENYEELGDKTKHKLYEVEFLNEYLKHCIKKIQEVVESQSNDKLLIEKNDYYKNMTKAERYINAIRHIQHHSAQLGLRLQYLTKEEMNWISRGYE